MRINSLLPSTSPFTAGVVSILRQSQGLRGVGSGIISTKHGSGLYPGIWLDELRLMGFGLRIDTAASLIINK